MPGVCPLPDPSLQSSSVSESLGSPCDAPPVSLSSFLVSFTNQLLKWDGEPVYIISSIIACIVINLLLRKSLNIAGWIENLERGRWCAPSHGFSSGSPGKSCQCQWLCNKDTMEVEHMISIISFGHPTWHREQPYRWLECRSWKWQISPASIFCRSLFRKWLISPAGIFRLSAQIYLRVKYWKYLERHIGRKFYFTNTLLESFHQKSDHKSAVTECWRFPPNWKWCHPKTGTTLGKKGKSQNMQKKHPFQYSKKNCPSSNGHIRTKIFSILSKGQRNASGSV